MHMLFDFVSNATCVYVYTHMYIHICMHVYISMDISVTLCSSVPCIFFFFPFFLICWMI